MDGYGQIHGGQKKYLFGWCQSFSVFYVVMMYGSCFYWDINFSDVTIKTDCAIDLENVSKKLSHFFAPPRVFISRQRCENPQASCQFPQGSPPVTLFFFPLPSFLRFFLPRMRKKKKKRGLAISAACLPLSLFSGSSERVG